MEGMSPVNRRVSNDTKDIRIVGCDVHLTFRQVGGDQWSVEATFRCGVGDKRREQSVDSGPCATREEAEQLVLGRVGDMLGHNVDSHTSRVTNPTEKNPR